MNSQYTLSTKLFFLFTFALLFTACTAGDAQFTEQKPGWFLLWSLAWRDFFYHFDSSSL